MCEAHRFKATVEYTWTIDSPQVLVLADMAARIAHQTDRTGDCLLVEEVTVEVTAKGDAPVGVALVVKDLMPDNDGSFEEATFVTHGNTYKSFKVYRVGHVKRKKLREQEYITNGVDWTSGAVYVTSPDPAARALVTVGVTFMDQVDSSL